MRGEDELFRSILYCQRDEEKREIGERDENEREEESVVVLRITLRSGSVCGHCSFN